jgi:hypothetical protein
MSVAALLNIKCDVYRRVGERTPTGGVARTLVLERLDVPTRMEEITNGWSVNLGARRVKGTHTFYFTSDPGLESIKSSLVYNGDQYQVLTSENVANMGRHWEVRVTHVGGIEEDGLEP